MQQSVQTGAMENFGIRVALATLRIALDVMFALRATASLGEVMYPTIPTDREKRGIGWNGVARRKASDCALLKKFARTVTVVHRLADSSRVQICGCQCIPKTKIGSKSVPATGGYVTFMIATAVGRRTSAAAGIGAIPRSTRNGNGSMRAVKGLNLLA